MIYDTPCDEKLVGLYSPSERKVACVLITAAYGLDSSVSHIVGTKNWFLFPPDDMIALSATEEQWIMFRDSSPEDRPGPEHFAKERV